MAEGNDNNGSMSLGEVGRKLNRLQQEFDNTVVPLGVYQERQRYVDRELADLAKWQEAHAETHKWLARLLAGTALTMLVTLVIILIQVIGGNPT